MYAIGTQVEADATQEAIWAATTVTDEIDRHLQACEGISYEQLDASTPREVERELQRQLEDLEILASAVLTSTVHRASEPLRARARLAGASLWQPTGVSNP